MMGIKGVGPKKVRQLWQELGIESTGELLYACNENRLVEYKGFGLKTQEDLKQKLEYYLKSRDKLHLHVALAATADPAFKSLSSAQRIDYINERYSS